MQHVDFNGQDARLVGSPAAALAQILSAPNCPSADFRPRPGQADEMVNYPAFPFTHRGPVDPAAVDSRLRLSVRALPSTESRVAAITQAAGFTFWGEAVSLVLAFVVRNPLAFPVKNLRATAPDRLLVSRGALRQGAALAPHRVRRISTPVTAAVMSEVDRIAMRNRLSPANAAALILHRHAPAVAAHVRLS